MGWVGQGCSFGTSLAVGTGVSTIGLSGSPVSRLKMNGHHTLPLVATALIVGLFYPFFEGIVWNKNFGLQEFFFKAKLGEEFHDFAGSTLVHSVGGWGALAGILNLGPRLGKYVNGSIRPILGHNISLATIGTFLLWFGWYGFNGGSVLSADPGMVSLVFVTTSLGAAAGMMGAMLTTWTVHKHPDLSMVLNGTLAGLVGITAGADAVSPMSSVIIGGVAGVMVVFAVMLFDRLRLDDPVGATSVHLVCGVWGTLAVGIFSPDYSFMTQLIGVGAYGVTSFASAYVILMAIKAVMGLRISEEDERRGLDLSEHNMEGYPDFTVFTAR